MTFLFRSPEGPPLYLSSFLFLSFSHTPPALLVLFGRALLPHTLTHLHINKMTMTSPRGNVTWRASKTKQKSTLSPAVCRVSSVVGVVCRASQEVSLPPSFFVAFGPQISVPPVAHCGFCGVEAEGKGKGKKEKRGKRTGKTDVSARVFRGMCLAPCWLLGEAGRA